MYHYRDVGLEEARSDDDEGKRRPEDVDRRVVLPADALDRHQAVAGGEQDAAKQHRLTLAEVAVGDVPLPRCWP